MLHFSWVCLCAVDPKQNEKFLKSTFYPLMSDCNFKKINKKMKNKMRDIQKTSNHAKDFLPGIKLAHENWWHRTHRNNVN